MTLLAVDDIDVSYGRTQVLFGTSLKVEEGQVVSILGSNGSGKTTLLRAIIGVLEPDSGTITYRGSDITGIPSHEIIQRNIAICPQGSKVFASLSVEENLFMGGVTKSKETYRENLREVLAMFPVLEEKREVSVEALSGGQQQMLAIARALISDPEFLILDEPSASLAPKIVGQVRRKIETILEDREITVLLVEQNVQFAMELCEYTYVLKNGSVDFEGPTETVKDSPRVREAFLGDVSART